MKKIYSIILVAIISLTQRNAVAQVWMGVYGMRTNSTSKLASPDIGGGFAMSFLSDAVSPGEMRAQELDPQKNIKEISSKSTGPKFQVGGGFYYSGLGHRTFEDVPLTSPQLGAGRVTISNAIWGMNVIGRFSLANKTIFTPYADVFIGYRGTFTNVSVTPYNQIPGYEKETDKPLTSLSGLNYGIGGGIMTSITKRLRLDLGVSYAESFQNGHVADLYTAYADQTGISLNMKKATNGIMMVNVGLMFYLYDDESSKDDCDCKCKHHSTTSTGVSLGGGRSWGNSGGRSNSVGIHVGGGGGFGGVRIK